MLVDYPDHRVDLEAIQGEEQAGQDHQLQHHPVLHEGFVTAVRRFLQDYL